jgi:hypothetical protein
MDRDYRIGLNESIFRDVNEQLEELADQFRPSDGELDLICECGNTDCEQRITVRRSDYERIRSDSRQFIVVPGHETEDIEDVIEQTSGYDVVRKRAGAAAQAAEENDLRAD